MGNDVLNVDSADVKEHQIEFSSVTQFKTQEEIDIMKNDGEDELIWGVFKVKDESVKTNCKTDEWKRAIVYLIYENYINTSVPVTVKNNDVDENEKSVRKQILEHYIITRNETDYILVDDINATLRLCKKKICNNLLNMMIIKKRSKMCNYTRDKYVYIGIVKKEVEDVEGDSETAF
jgi:hypothetical protein